MHAIYLVIGEYPADILEKYHCEYEYNLYPTDQIATDDEIWMALRSEEAKEILERPDTRNFLPIGGQDLGGRDYIFNNNGIIEKWTTSNPNALYDYYTIGGRWTGFIPLKTGEVADQAYVKEIRRYKTDFVHSNIYGIIDKGGYKEEFSFSKKKDWLKYRREYLRSLSSNTLISVADLHI